MFGFDIESNVQSYELILIDDGSDDNSLLICKEYEAIDSRIKVYHQLKSGPSAARNIGISLAQGTYMAFIDADDYIKPAMFTELIKLMEHHQCDLVISPMTLEYLYFKNKRLKSPVLKYEGKIYTSEQDAHKIFSLFESAMINSPCARIYKTEIIKANQLAMPVGIHYAEDLIFNIEYLKCSESIFISNQSYYFYTIKKSGSLTTSYGSQLFQSINLAHDKSLAYLLEDLKINKELQHLAYYFTVPNTIVSILNLFYQDCPLTRSEKKAYIHSIVHDSNVMDKIKKAHKPGVLPKLYKLLLKTRYTTIIYYTCKWYKSFKNYTLFIKDLSRRTT